MGILAGSSSFSTSFYGARVLQHRDRGAPLGAILMRHFFSINPSHRRSRARRPATRDVDCALEAQWMMPSPSESAFDWWA